MSAAAGKPILYSKWFSSCSHRVRIALNLKGVDFEYRATNPMTDPDYKKINPVNFVPALVDGDLVVSDSFAIKLYMEDKYPQHPLLSQDLKNKALNLQIASIVCSSIQPLQSHAVIGSFLGTMDADESLQMVQHYIDKGFKGVDYEYKAVDPRTDADYEKINPIKYVPALVDGDFVVSDSLAIILYLEDKYPQHPLLPKDLKKKALDLQIANIICSSIQPLQSYGVIGHEGRLSPDESLQLVQRYIDKGFRAIEKLLDGCISKYSIGDEVHLGDVFLAPQIHAAIHRFQIDMTKYPILAQFHEAYMEIPAFQAALPQNQPDAPST